MVKQRKRNTLFASDSGSDSKDYSQDFAFKDKKKRLECQRKKNADYQKHSEQR